MTSAPRRRTVSRQQHSSSEPVRRVVVVGGGTAGWLSACLVASKGRRSVGTDLSVTVIEAPAIPTIGVGEGTWPTMRATLADIGLDEADVLASCDAALKQGSRFDGWRTGEAADSYFHPFTAPPAGNALDLVSAWRSIAPQLRFAHAVSAQPAVCQAGLAPRQAMMPPYAGALNYAYHLDAAKLGARLSRHAVEALGVDHIADEVTEVVRREDGGIAALRTRGGTLIEGDLFLDCSGQRGLLIEGHLGVEWVDRSGSLANDRALAVQVPVGAGTPIECQTIATAHEAGWLWDIGLPTRRGIGCVYSSRFLDEAGAHAVLHRYVERTAGPLAAQAMTPRALSFRTGHRRQFWKANCIAIGLSAGFIEPLEASAIVMIELSVRALIDGFPASAERMEPLASRFNALFTQRWDRIVEFLKLHYVLSERTEPYWHAQREAASIPPRLAELLQLWRDHPPSAYDLPLSEEIFPAASYQYVYYGMSGRTPEVLPPPDPTLVRQLQQVGERSRSLLSPLPSHRGLLTGMSASERPQRVAH